MSRVIELLVYGAIAATQLFVTLHLIGRYTHSAISTAPARGVSITPQRALLVRPPATLVSGTFSIPLPTQCCDRKSKLISVHSTSRSVTASPASEVKAGTSSPLCGRCSDLPQFSIATKCLTPSLLLCTGLLNGCASFHETHYFVQTANNGKAKNYLRLQVDGSTALSSARYVSGYFDPQAIDLYFNEMRGVDPSSPDRYLIPSDVAKVAASRETAVGYSLNSQTAHGDLVMILSTNATAVTDTIGAFSESNTAARAVSNLINKPLLDRYRAEQVQSEIDGRRQAAVKDHLNNLVVALQTASSANSENYVLEILNVIATQFGRTSTFSDYPEAVKWFEVEAAADESKQ